MKRRVQNFQRDSYESYGGQRDEDRDPYPSIDGLYTIHYTKKDVNNFKDTKSLQTLSKLDSSIERFVKSLNESKERKKTESAGKSSPSKDDDDSDVDDEEEDDDDDDDNDNDDDVDDVEDQPGEEKLPEKPEDGKDGKTEKNGKSGHRDYDEYSEMSEDDFYDCVNCPEVSLSVGEIKKHYKERHLIIFYDCLKCGFSTRCYDTMTDHICKYHDNDTSLMKRKIYQITRLQDDVPIRVDSIFANSQRNRIHQPQEVPVSNQLQNSDSFMQNHQELTIDSDKEKLDYEESDESDTEMMTNGSGSGSGRYECKVCLQEFTRSERVREHYDAIHLNMVYTCSICGYTNRWKRSVIQHLRSKHQKSPPYKPLMIKKRVESNELQNQPSTSRLAASLDLSHSNDITPCGSSIGGDDDPKRNRYTVDDEGPVHKDLIYQKLTHSIYDDIHEQQSSSANSTPQLHLPSTSSGIMMKPQTFASNLKLSLIAKEKQYKAKDGKINLKECYMKISDDQYQCTKCAKTCGSSQGIVEHYEAFHLNMAYTCQLCGFTDIWRSMMTKHLRQKHQLSKPYDGFLKRGKLDETSWKPFNHRNSSPKQQKLPKRRSMPSNGTSQNGVGNSIPSRGSLSALASTKLQSQTIPKSIPLAQSAVDSRLELLRLASATQFYTFHKFQPPFDQLLSKRSEPNSNYLLGSSEKHKSMSIADDACGSENDEDDEDIDNDDRDDRDDGEDRDDRDDHPNNHRGDHGGNDDENDDNEDGDEDDLYFNSSEQPSGSNTDDNPSSPLCLDSSTHHSPSMPDQIYLCNICQKPFGTLRGLKEHHEGMHSDMVWACKLCPFTDKWRPQAASHVRRRHSCGPPYNDNLIRKRLTDSSSLTPIHQDQASAANFVPQLNLPSTSSGKIAKPHSGALNLSAHSNDKKKQDDIKEKINLKECYMKISGDQYQCTKCAKTCGSSQGIMEHYEAFHLNMAYTCQLCGFTDIWRSMMTKHLKQKHQLSKPYDGYLERVKLDPSTRRSFNHSHSAPPEQPPHEIGSMEPSGTSHESSKNNIPSKELGKQYFHQDNQLKCKLCGSSFTSLQGFHEHYEAIHLNVIWSCRECTISFRWRQQLTKHLKLIHKCNPPFNEYMLKETGSHKLKRPRSHTTTTSTNQPPGKEESANHNSPIESRDSIDSPSQEMEYSDGSPEPIPSPEDLSICKG